MILNNMKDGIFYWIELNISLMFDEIGVIDKFFVVFCDIIE